LADSSIPDCSKLLWNDRLPDQLFDTTELLYFRVEKFDELGKVSPFDIRCPDTSVNRQKYSEPGHVLCAKFPKFVGHKVAQLQVCDIPSPIVHPEPKDGREFQFKVVHVPVRPPVEPDENYAHCEIQAFHKQQRWGKPKMPGLIDKIFRQKLAEVMKPAVES